MEREEMVAHCMKGGLLFVDANKSGYLFKSGLFTQKAVRRQLIFRSLTFAFLAIGVVAFFFFTWYVGILLVLLALLSGRAAHKHAALTSFTEALTTDKIFLVASQLNLLRIGGEKKKSSEYAFGKDDLPLKATFEYTRKHSPIVCEPVKTASGRTMRVYRSRERNQD